MRRVECEKFEREIFRNGARQTKYFPIAQEKIR
jgi:hypothetical protein